MADALLGRQRQQPGSWCLGAILDFSTVQQGQYAVREDHRPASGTSGRPGKHSAQQQEMLATWRPRPKRRLAVCLVPQRVVSSAGVLGMCKGLMESREGGMEQEEDSDEPFSHHVFLEWLSSDGGP